MIHHELIIDPVHQNDFKIPKSIHILVRFRNPDHQKGANDFPSGKPNAYYYITPDPNISVNQIPGIDYQLRYCEQNKVT